MLKSSKKKAKHKLLDFSVQTNLNPQLYFSCFKNLSTNLKSNKMSIFSQMSSIYVLKDWNVDFSRMKLLVNDCWPVCLYSLQSSPYVCLVIYLCSSLLIHILQNPHHYFLFILNQIDLIGKITLPFLSNDLTPPLNRMIPTTWSNQSFLPDDYR